MKNVFNKIYDFLKNNIKEIIFDITIIGLIIFLSYFNFPYVIYKPGGIIYLNNRIEVNNGYKMQGSYNMAYVAVSKGNLINIISSFLIKDWDLKKEEEIVIENLDYDTTFRIEQLELKLSNNLASLIALNKAKINYDIKNKTNTVLIIDENAKTDIQLLDEIQKIDNKECENLAELKDYINNKNIGDTITIKVKNDEKEYTRHATIYELEGQKIIGIGIYTIYDIITNPELIIKTKNSEAGSSGGLMMTLAIYDSLIEEDLTHGKKIVGTGTINEDETVGPIGGIKYKLLGAEKEKADIFFVAKDNYKEAKKIYDKYNMSFELISVEKIDDAINYLNSIK